MTSRVRSAFGRFLARGAAVVALLTFAGTLASQETAGKLEGTVSDQAGVALANAQVFVVGTSFGAVTNDRGYYFINSVPVGTYTVRAQFIGYAPSEVRGVRVSGGQTITVDVTLQASAVEVTGITVTAAANPIVPRDQVTSKHIVSGELLRGINSTDVREVIRLEPGVVESGSAKGVSIRGGRPGEAAVYVDGVLVRNAQQGQTNLQFATISLEEAAVTTGALGAEFGEASSGVLAYVTRAGGQQFFGSLSAESDDLGLWSNVGFNRLQGSFGGPLFGNLTFFLGATATGRQSLETQLDRDKDRPIYLASGVDTVVAQPLTVGDPLSDTVQVQVPRFVQYSGDCPAAADAGASPLKQDIAGNYGSECQGIRLPLSANAEATGNLKLQYTYGAGSRISVTGLTSVNQARLLPLTGLYNPSNQTGQRFTSNAAILNWNQNLSKSAERAMALDVNVSYQTDATLQGPLTRQSELDSRDPFGGFLLNPLEFIVDFDTQHDVTIAGTTYSGVRYLDDRQLDCLLAGQASCRDLVPLLDRDDAISAQPYRMNPYAAEQSARQPHWTRGTDAGVLLIQEKRWQARANFDWQVDRFNRIKLGGEFHRVDTRRYSTGSLISAFGLSAYHETPVRYGAYIEDRLDLGDVVLVGGLRYDRFSSDALYPLIPGRISSASSSIVLDGDTITFAPFDPLNPTANMVKAPSHDVWSPRVQVSFPVTERSNFRLSYAHQVQSPDYDLMFRGKNNDISASNPNQSFGRDLDFTKSVIFEFGIRHAFSRDMVLDVSAYNKDKTSDVAGRLVSLPDPGKSGADGDFRIFNNADFGNVRGVDLKLDRRFTNLFSGSVAYTFQVAKNTGSDPFSYFRTTARVISTLTGETQPPPQAILPTDDNRTHNIAGSLALTFPNDWRQGTGLGQVFRNVSAFATFRFASGLPYTRIRNSGEGVTQGQSPLEFTNIEPINSSTMPWFKNVDLRVAKGFRFGRLDLLVYGQASNLFNFRNTNNLFLETGDVVNAQHRDRYVSEQVTNLESQARAAGFLVSPVGGENYIDFVNFSCSSWAGRNTPGSGASGPVDCVLLTRAEARYGNGDGMYTATEYERAFAAWYNLGEAPSQFYGAGRRIRLGVEISF